jgi:hypothetical protein
MASTSEMDMGKAYSKRNMALSDTEACIPGIAGKLAPVSPDPSLAKARNSVPVVIYGFRLPNYMRSEKCGIMRTDTGNSILEGLVRQMPILEPEEHFMDMFLGMLRYPFMLIIPKQVCILPNEKRPLGIALSIVTNIQRNYHSAKLNKQVKRSHVDAMASIEVVIRHISDLANVFRDPLELAAIAIVAFSMYPCFTDHEWNIRAGAFLGNAILMAESKPPLYDEFIESKALLDAIRADVSKWRLRTQKDVCYENVLRIIKLVPRRCFMCGEHNPKPCDKCGEAWYCGKGCVDIAKQQHAQLCLETVVRREAFEKFLVDRKQAFM